MTCKVKKDYFLGKFLHVGQLSINCDKKKYPRLQMLANYI